jgi:predicted PurR-regulated permease PerM
MERVRRISTQRAFAVLVVVGIILYLIRPILLPFVLAGAIAFAVNPAVEWLTARFRWRRWMSSVLVFIVLTALFAAFAFLTLPALFSEVLPLLTNLKSILQNVLRTVLGDGRVEIFGSSATAEQLAAQAADGLRSWLLGTGRALSFATVGSAAVFGVFLFLAVLLYFLVGGPRIAGRLLWLVPPKQRTMVQHLWSKIAPVLRRYFIGLSIVVCYGAAAAYIGLGLVLDLPGAVVLAMLTGILELIPLLGPAASALLAGVVAIHSATGIGALIGYGVYAAVLRVSIDQIIGPIVLGKSAYLHPVLIIFCFLAGGYLFGVVGLLMAVPVALTIRIVLHELYEGPGFHVGEPEETEGGRHG